ncbi:NAD(P)-binding protein [Paenibacillus thiaminolyticus]|uniref:NAD(P)-binding protein n=1 Tax=Paenibacillus thiaminolyticus TaxID=49283 RepID=UPI00232E2BB1|nr:NAD(P)-binding protein [Paenibacillus thiaminolyticus]WCF07928.1 NAD(P)-binding protein [Paenibacillus thiaminolyticus]
MTTAVVVGGGISGILSALLLKDSFNEVYLIEKQAQIGGLLNSHYVGENLCFDYGTHIVSETGVSKIDELLLDFVKEDVFNWNKLTTVSVGNYFRGCMNNEGPCIDGRLLDPAEYEKGISEFLHAWPEGNYSNLCEQLRGTYGITFAERIFAPVLQKLFGVDVNELAVNSHELFVSGRLMLFNEQVTRELKKIPIFDDRLAYHSHHDRRTHYYPKKSGMGLWITGLKTKLMRHGIKLLTNEYVSHVLHTEGIINGIRLGSTRETIRTDHLVWTLPPSLLLKTAGGNVDYVPSQARRVQLFHFIFDKPFQTTHAYINCYDPGLYSSRITLYPNLATEDRLNRCTVEVLYNDRCQITEHDIVTELKLMGIVPSEAEASSVYVHHIAAGFPIRTIANEQALRTYAIQARDKFMNLTLVGRAGGGSFFMNDVLRGIYSSLQEKGYTI